MPFQENKLFFKEINSKLVKIDIMKHLNEQKELEDKMPIQEQHKYLIL